MKRWITGLFGMRQPGLRSRRWLIVLSLVTTLSPLLGNIPAASANSSGTCIQSDTLGCVTLIVNLSPAPTTPATIHLKREGTSGTDDSFDLSPINNQTYTSGGPIWDTEITGTTCSEPPFPPNAYFDITVTGSATGSSNHVNLCFNASPTADPNTGRKTITVNVTALNGGTGSGPGGIKGQVFVKPPAGDTKP
jgi:hypothetical protein